jgi:hypothetical protein
MAGVGDLVATIAVDGAEQEEHGSLPLLAYAMREHRVSAPATAGLADVVEGRADAEAWAAGVTAPGGRRKAA